MFFKGSRYKDLPEITATGADGRKNRAITIRRIPDTPGTFSHVVTQVDRPDLMAYKYYHDIKKWWLICDANPDFAMPTDLVLRDPIVKEIFELVPPENTNNWPLLIKDLNDLRGMGDVLCDTFKKTVSVTYNSKELLREEMISVIASHGFAVENVSKEDRLGRTITIPPNRVV